MRFRRSGRPDRDAADRLLDSPTPPTGADPDPLARLLAAAAAPAQPDELAGEEAAMAAFRTIRAAAPEPATPPASSRRRGTGAVAWIAGLATVATAGVAVAAGGLGRTGSPTPPPTPVTPSGSAAATSTAPATTTTRSGAAPTTSGVPSLTTGTTRPSSGDLDARGLCAALLSKGSAERAREISSPRYRQLVVAAGGQQQVEGYCRQLLQTPPEPAQRPTERPDRPSRVPTENPIRTGSQLTPGPR
ncbi:hypothetical protein V6U90_21835 [Micromonospora sp. CPCC 206060]|uniref:hypothetical protein n=1 Tax=Micromonospora sp. CPCC 206060 TaxID=3122406 RepID=UPI002FF33A30